MVKAFLNDPTCTEITVEDPNESFDDLRDYCDYNRLTQNGTLAQVALRTDLDPKLTQRKPGTRVPTSKLLDPPLLESLRVKNKIAPRQFSRLVELHLLSKIPAYTRKGGTARLTQRGKSSDEGDRAHYYWRLLVKQRIYKQNKDLLIQLEKEERVEKLEQTLEMQKAGYEQLLERLQTDVAEEGEGVAVREGGRKKRKIVEEDDDEEEEEGVENGNGEGPRGDVVLEERGRKRFREDEG